MDSFQQDIRSLFQRDLDRLIENLQATPEQELWHIPEGVSNSIGVLVQHLVGNLNHFIGEAIGKTGYVRQREQEFVTSHATAEELTEDIKELQHTLDRVFDAVDEETLDEEYPLDVSYEFSTGGFLIHLYGHLNYHLGQVNYLRRIISEKG